MEFDGANHYPQDVTGEASISRVRLRPSSIEERFTVGSGRNEQAGDRLLLIDVTSSIARAIEKGNAEALDSLMEAVEAPNRFHIRARAYLAQITAKRGYRLIPIPEGAVVTEGVATAKPSAAEEGKQSLRSFGVLDSEFIEVQ